jgi:hypothetical protein
MHVSYVGWKETIAESYFEDNRSADNKDLFYAIAVCENLLFTGLEIENKRNMLFYTLVYASLDN